MLITQLKIAGFKSFVDPVEVQFEEGLTGIVGPNGCGKSNILEALRWAMGATSARAMRGGEMDDLIFSGTESRPPRERAEVTLVIDNTARTAPALLNDEDVLEIKRMLRRGAGSTYKVNGATVRAKDVQLLFADASTGANSPALVRQGQISELIASKPQNRRRILEEAAGIAGLNQRRHEAELKLRAALTNLEQLEQVIGEVDRQAAQLKRQASKARRFKELTIEAESLETALIAMRWRSASDERCDLENAVKAAKQAIDAALTAEAAVMSVETNRRATIMPLREDESQAAGRLGALKIQLAQLETERKASSDGIKRIESDLVRIQSDIDREQALTDEARDASAKAEKSLSDMPKLDEQTRTSDRKVLQQAHEAARKNLAEAEARIDQQAAELAAAEAEQKSAQAAVDREQNRIERLSQQISTAESGLSELGDQGSLETSLKDAKADLAIAEKNHQNAKATALKAEKAAATAKADEDALAPRLQELEKQARLLEAEIAGLDRLLAGGDPASSAPILNETKPQKGLERALAAALGDDLNAPRNKEEAQYWTSNHSASDAPPLPEGVSSLADLVEAPEELLPRLQQCGVTTAKDATRLQKQLKTGQRLVSRNGDLWRWDGFVRTQKAPSPAAERLEQQARRDTLKSEFVKSKKDAQKYLKQFERAQAKAEKTRLTFKESSQRVPEAASSSAQAREGVLRAEQELERLFLRSSALTNNLARLTDEQAEATQELKTAKALLNKRPSSADRTRLDKDRQALAVQRQKERSAEIALADFDRDQDRLEGKRRALKREFEDWTRREKAAADHLAKLLDTSQQLRAQLDAAKSSPDELAAKTEHLVEKVETAESERSAAADALSRAEALLREAESDTRSAREATAKARESIARTEARLEAAQRREEEVAEQARGRFGCELAQLEARAKSTEHLLDSSLSDATEDANSQSPSLHVLETHLAELRRKIDSIGPVNLEAEDQLDEMASRMETQSKERDDLSAAIAKLQEGVAALNKEGASRLTEAFETINEHFKSLFETLFQGGEAHLKLTESDDPLQAGLEIYASPPGKRLGTLSLMSGGEQALTATALIFAVFLCRPSPLCVLDEVDAPLDDANVDRYCRMLNEMRKRTDTRFVVITHNAVTMSRMDRLFGVTMQERGVSKLVSVDLQAAEQLAAAE